ncbi:MAG TPA: hypothetical protein VN837_05460 [Chloroflexota bacterium]|nr:hypothetical protein [Chloroflexota bacterium]
MSVELDECMRQLRDHSAVLFGRHRAALGFTRTASLDLASVRNELFVTAHGAAYVWRRLDGQTTIHAIVSEARGEGSLLLARLIADSRSRGQTQLLAKCPADLPANAWYARRGFVLAGTEAGKRRPLNLWRLALG